MIERARAVPGTAKANAEDIRIAEAIRSGDENAFEQLFFNWYELLCRFACRYTGSMFISEELVQDAFANLWENRETLGTQGSLRTWLYQSVKHRALDYLKHQKVEEKYEYEVEQRLYEEVYESRVESKGCNGFQQNVQLCIEELPETTRNIYKLSRVEGFTYPEIATILEVSVKSVEFHMSKALNILRDRLSKFLPSLLLYIIQKFVA